MKSLTLQRIAAVDVFRALTMFLMLFVNDIPGLKNVPHWLMHARIDEDMMGFSDTIFPAFLFCMGMSVSFAIQNRYKKGDNTLQVVTHIFWRTVALIAMGLFSLNSGGIEAVPELKILSSSPEAGVYAIKTDQGRQIFLMGHAEYDRDTLRNEYMRDLVAGVDIHIPENYFPDDDPQRKPVVTWRSCAHLLYSNWLNYFVYQTAPYDIRDIRRGIRTDD